MYRALYEASTRRHFLGEVLAAEGSTCRLQGYVFVYDKNEGNFIRKNKVRTTIMDLAESGYIVNVIDSAVELENVIYKYLSGEGVVVTDMKDFSININEFTARS